MLLRWSAFTGLVSGGTRLIGWLAVEADFAGYASCADAFFDPNSPVPEV